MRHLTGFTGCMLLSCIAIALTALPFDRATGAESLLSKYEHSDRRFEEYRTGDLLVYYHTRMLDQATVEGDYIVYQFDKNTEDLLAVKSHWREDLPEHLPSGLISREQAEGKVDGEILRARLYIISPESDVFPLVPTPGNPCWVVRHVVKGRLVVTIVDAVEGVVLGNGVPPPYTGFSLSGPWDFNPCSGTWASWRQNAKTWFETMGYPTESIAWPTEDEVRGHVQSCETAMFYELAHGGHTMFENGCIDGVSAEITYASEIETWLADYPKMPFAFIGSCGGLCWKMDGSFAYEFRKGEPESSTVVGYCDMAEPHCDACWSQSIAWQTALFDYMSQGWTVADAFLQANADYPACGDSNCTRFAGDRDFAVVPVVRRDPWPPAVDVMQPDGGETLEYGTVYAITWEALDNAPIDSVTILLSLDGGIAFPDTIAAGELNDGSYLWDVPDIDSKTARIRVVAVDCALNEGEAVSASDFTLWGSISGAEYPDVSDMPSGISLEIRGGNPMGRESRVVFGLPVAAGVRLAVYDVAGRCLGNLVDGRLPEGYHAVRWSDCEPAGARLGPGIYFLRLVSGEDTRTVKAIVAR
jgi:hypothetical protein